jgi:uncharacterized phage protein (TIGR02218 family)
MRTPTWETAPGALAQLLNGIQATQLRWADLYTFTLSGGAAHRYSASDEPVTLGDRSFHLGPLLSRGTTRIGPGIAVDELEVAVSASDGVQVNGMPLLRFITGGGLDGARLVLERAFSAGPGQAWTGALALFSGRIGTVEGGRHAKSLQVRSDTELLDALVPRHVYQPGCLNTVYDDTCGVQRQAHRSTGTAAGGTDASRTSFNHNQAVPVDHWTLGDITMTSGANAGIARTVRRNEGQGVSVIVPWPFPVNVGDTFTVQLGCDGSQGMCSGRFANLGRYRGMPFIPVAEMVT